MNLVKQVGLLLVALMVVMMMTAPAAAEEAPKTGAAAASAHSFASPAWGAGLGAGMVIIGAALGFGRIGAAALESMARQPETAGRVQTAMIIIAALLEGVAFFALVICFIIGGKA
jgi:F-type H+-transporting ATPase subunit c